MSILGLPKPPSLTGPQIGLIRAADLGRLWRDTRTFAALLVTDKGLVDVSPDVAVLVSQRLVWHDPIDVTLPPEMQRPYVLYHPTPRGDDVLMAAAQRNRKAGRRD